MRYSSFLKILWTINSYGPHRQSSCGFLTALNISCWTFVRVDMAESQDSVMFQFPKLNAENYTTWKVDMKVLLIEIGCWEFVVGESKPPTED